MSGSTLNLLRIVVRGGGSGRLCPGGIPEGSREIAENFRRLLGVLLAPFLQISLQGGRAVLLDFDEPGPPRVGEGDELGPSVFGVGPAVDEAQFLEFGDVPAEDRCADAQPGGQMR